LTYAITKLKNELSYSSELKSQLRNENQALKTENHYLRQKNHFIAEISEIKEGITLLMLRMMHGKIPISQLKLFLKHRIELPQLENLYHKALYESPHSKKRALALLFHLCGISQPVINKFLFIGRNTMKRYIRKFEKNGIDQFFNQCYKGVRTVDNPFFKEVIISTIHTPPTQFGFNRTSWTTKTLKTALASKGMLMGKNSIRKIIKKAGYKFWKAKEVLTSNDPLYKEKLIAITRILSRLGPKDKFFSIDEFGPFAVKERGGRRIVKKDEYPTIPQFQPSKGSLIVTAALELSTNQITHFYSDSKNSTEIIRMLHVLIKKYAGCRVIYLSWDHASWHSSEVLFTEIKERNKYENRKKCNAPIVKIAPLPARAQFLNVIESVFSGMASAIIQNSNYQSIEDAKHAINLYFKDRNKYFRKHPKRAGKKIWGNELVPATFKEGQNCKNPRWR